MKIIKSHAYSRKINGFPGNRRFLNNAKAASPGAPISDAAIPRTTAESGFTLTEIVVASVILAFMVITLYGGISFGFSSVTLARQNLRATQIALEKMEITRMICRHNFDFAPPPVARTCVAFTPSSASRRNP